MKTDTVVMDALDEHPKPQAERHTKPQKSRQASRFGFQAAPLMGSPQYDGGAIDAILSFHTFRTDFTLWWHAVERFFRIMGFFCHMVFTTWWINQVWTYLGEDDIDLAQSERRKLHGAKITKTLLDLGPTFIKVGQSLSTRVDLIRREYIDELAKLQDSVPPFPIDQAIQTIVVELGDHPDALFATFDPVPIAAASLGQVHRVTLFDGTDAVIKVQRPGLIAQFEVDLSVLKKVARFLETRTDLGRGREWVKIMDEFGRTLFEEVDYIQEGRNADLFRKNFARFDATQKGPAIVVPEIIWRYTARRVITMTYCPGIKINDTRALDEAGFPREAIAVQLVNAYFQQLLLDGFFHADPHPGNIVINASGQIVFYDFGMVGHIVDETRVKIVRTFLNLVAKRVDAILKNLEELDMINPGADLEEIRQIIDWSLDNYYDVPHDQLNFEQLADEMAEVMYHYPFKLPATFTFMFRAMITLEGVATLVYPQVKFMGIAVDYAQQFIQKRYIVDKLLNFKVSGNIPRLISDGLELLGIQSQGQGPVPSRVRLYYEEWKPIARYVKASMMVLFMGQAAFFMVGLAMALSYVHQLPIDNRFPIVFCMVAFVLLYLTMGFATIFFLPARKKPFHFNPPTTRKPLKPNPTESVYSEF